MPSQDQFDDTLAELSAYVDRIGDERVGDVSGQTGGGDPASGVACRHGDHHYLVLGTPDWNHFLIRYPLNVDQAVAQRHLVSSPSQIDDSVLRQARDRLETELNGQPEEEKKKLRFYLMHIMSREGCVVNFNTTSGLNIHGFDLDKIIYPYEPDFSLREFHLAVQSTIDLGWVGKELLLDHYGLLQVS